MVHDGRSPIWIAAVRDWTVACKLQQGGHSQLTDKGQSRSLLMQYCELMGCLQPRPAVGRSLSCKRKHTSACRYCNTRMPSHACTVETNMCTGCAHTAAHLGLGCDLGGLRLLRLRLRGGGGVFVISSRLGRGGALAGGGTLRSWMAAPHNQPHPVSTLLMVCVCMFRCCSITCNF